MDHAYVERVGYVHGAEFLPEAMEFIEGGGGGCVEHFAFLWVLVLVDELKVMRSFVQIEVGGLFDGPPYESELLALVGERVL